MIKISKYMDPRCVLFLDVVSRDASLQALTNRLAECGKLVNKEKFYEAILEREKIVSTGIGMGIAIPHAKLPDYDDFFIAIAVLQKGVDWHALDGASVRLIFMIGGPDDKQTEYLQILSRLTTGFKDEELRKKMLTRNSAAAMIALCEDL